MVLHNGFNFPRHGKTLKTLQKIGGTEVQWALGALIYKSRFLPLRFVHFFTKNFRDKKIFKN